MNRRPDLNDIRLLMQVVEHGSYTAAAQAIGIPKSTISQRIAQLEAAVGTGLLRRTSRSFSLTEAGAQLLPHARAIDELARQVESTLSRRGDELHGVLRINCSQAVAQFALAPIMPRFLALHPQVTIKVEANNRFVDMIGEGFDMTIRGHIDPLNDSALIRRIVGHPDWALVSSPQWAEENGPLTKPEDVANKAALCFVSMPDFQSWIFRRDRESRRVVVTPRLISDDMLAIAVAAAGSAGLAYLPGYVVRNAIDRGGLVHLLPSWECQTSTISVLTPPKSQSSRLATAFSAYLAGELPAKVRFRPEPSSGAEEG